MGSDPSSSGTRRGTSMKSKFLTAAIFAGGLTVSATSADAATVVGFDDNIINGGTVSYSGGTSALVGTDIRFDRVSGIDTPSNNGVAGNCTSCTLNFTTGSKNGTSGFEWNGGGSFTITGSLDGPLPVVGPTTLLSGSFVSDVSVTNFGGGYLVGGVVDPATLNSALASFYGVATTGTAFLVQIAFGGTPNENGFSASTTNSDVDYSPVPIPAALPLFLTALAGIGLIGRRQNQQTAAAA